MYGAEILKKAQEEKLEVAEMRILRWMCGQDKEWKNIREAPKVGEIAQSLGKEVEVVWYWVRREEHYVGRMAMEMKAHGRGFILFLEVQIRWRWK